MFGTGNLLRPRRPPCSGDVSCMRPRRPSLHNKHAVPSRLMPDVVPRERPGGASSACGSGHNGNAFTWFLFSDLSVGNKLSVFRDRSINLSRRIGRQRGSLKFYL